MEAVMKNVRKIRVSESPKQDDLLIGLLYAWMIDGALDAKNLIRRYCEYICFRGYPEFASDIVVQLEGLDKWKAEEWIRQTHALYVSDDRTMLRYVFGLEIRKEK